MEAEPIISLKRNLKLQNNEETNLDSKRPKVICCFYVERKKRFCRMTAAKGRQYCGQHLVEDSSPDENGRIRIPCPLDPKHSVYSHLLEQHLRVCNAKEPLHLPYYSKGINGGSATEECGAESAAGISLNGRLLANLVDKELLSLIELVLKTEKDMKYLVLDEHLVHPSMVSAVSEASLLPTNRKHLVQNASLVDHLHRLGAFKDEHNTEQVNEINIKSSVPTLNGELPTKSTFIEFGAGRGHLSHWVGEASSSRHALHSLLVDRGAQRYKMDSRTRQASNLTCTRVRVDIGDLALTRVPDICLQGTVFAGGKHLCGAATDLTVRCLVNAGVLGRPSAADGSSTVHGAVEGRRGLVIALCCHHRCTWQHYTGKHFLASAGVGEAEFPALLGLTSWAVCAAKPPQTQTSQSSTTEPSDPLPLTESVDNEHLATADDPAALNRYVRLGLSVDHRAAVGRAAKRLIDHGRLVHLRHLGLHARLVSYVSSDITLENVALLAHQ